MTPTNGDPALYMLVKYSTMTGILGAYVDDSMFSVGTGFEILIDSIMHKFDSKSLEWDDLEFLSIRVESNHLSDRVVLLIFISLSIFRSSLISLLMLHMSAFNQ